MADKDKASLDTVVSKLSKEGMPVFAGTSKLIMSLSSHDKTSVNDLTWAILKDTSLTSRLLRLANSMFFNRDGRRVSTVSRAILQLGFDTVRSVCIFSMIIEDMVKGARRDQVSREMITSFHAAVQARNLAIARGDSGSEEVFIAALLHRIGHIAFWIFGDELADALDEAIKMNPGVPQDTLEREVLGFSLKALSLGLTEEWDLGGLVRKSLAAGESDKRTRDVQIGHAIAMGMEEGRDSQRMKSAVAAVVQSLRLSREDAEKLIRSNTEEAFQAASDYGLEQYAWLIPTISDGEKEAQAPTAETTIFQQPDPLLQLEVLNELSALVKEKPLNFNMFLSALIEGIYRGVGMDRVIFAVMSPDKKSVSGRYALGWEQGRIGEFQFSAKSVVPNIITSVLSEKEACWANGNATCSGLHVNEEVRNTMSGKFFFIAPIMIKGNVLGIISCDRSLSRRELDEKSFCCFKYFAYSANALLSSAY